MKLLRGIVTTALLVGMHNVYSADYSLDASTMAVGATAEENLVVKEGCINLEEKCDVAQKAKWFSAPLTKVGSLDIGGSLQGDFEINLTININNGSKGIVLLTPDNKSIEYNISWYGGSGGGFSTPSLLPKGIGEGGSSRYGINGWNSMPSFNNISFTVRQGVAKVYINGGESLLDPITFDKNTVFSRVLIKGISSSDRLSEVKVRGLQSASFCSGGGSTTTPTTTDSCAANYNAGTGKLTIPCVAVPVSLPFGGTQTLNYSVDMQQRTNTFAFDLDLNSLKQR
ncbi:hypothetical protein [Beggiatoa leptomitoformis]|uniref:DUF1080 domain-containing protein n=1 Tax=Beggiatoa leptomitoformis TaxID=288004 RepID=A0A2N9YER7_9GAMM|nr:hypothetical protein [Beggiatoa leptomitoformis]ALG68675.1 hypothetical protein AL038_14405 [Beggiatoa leptomitoformis]AUI68972.1 hypothetical protein BLE401_09855 [Beggiatoa leptomitoformis]